MATSKASATKRSVRSSATIIEEIRKGFEWERVERFQEIYGLKDERVARIIGLSDRTLTRHRKERERLHSGASDRFYRAERIIELANSVFEDKDEAMRWLRRPQPGLVGMI